MVDFHYIRLQLAHKAMLVEPLYLWGLMSMQLGKGPTRIWACCMGQVASMALHDGGNPVRWRELKNAPLHGCNTICQGPQAAIQIISVIGSTT